MNLPPKLRKSASGSLGLPLSIRHGSLRPGQPYVGHTLVHSQSTVPQRKIPIILGQSKSLLSK